MKFSIWNSIKQHSSENSCGFLAFPITLLTNMSASSRPMLCVWVYSWCVCVCILHYCKWDFQDVPGINNFTNKATTVPSAWWISFPKVSMIPLNLAHKTRQFSVLVQTFKVWAHSRFALSLEETFLLELCADPPCVIKQASQCVDLSDSNGEHDKQVETGPEGHPPQIVL